MTDMNRVKRALIVGVGDGLSAAISRKLTTAGYVPALASRNVDKLSALAAETSASTHACDAGVPEQVERLFQELEGHLDVCVYNASARPQGAIRGPIAELAPGPVQEALASTAYGAFLVGRAAAKRMLSQPKTDVPRGTILFTGASAGVKGFANSAPFAMGKFAQRGLAQSMARELHPQGIHVAWINIDGQVRMGGRIEAKASPASMLDPEAIADAYLSLIRQHPSAWADELTLRPWVETF
ncbi:MAG: SDR family NAD(P)-dependent oxidoreductase [Elainellaceae cyanobacterium]